MVTSVPFSTRARTIDHLGREQIADCPTAISELWKNAYDAYSREVALHIFDCDTPVAAVLDYGHGMDKQEFINKWLVIGTESKATHKVVPEKDRNGLPERPRQGQKGIGRLSSAALGPLLLLISKRVDQPFVAALIDWRIFENPFLLMHDVEIPVEEFTETSQLHERLPEMFDALMSNIWGTESTDKSRSLRIQAAWDAFDNQEKEAQLENGTSELLTREKIEQTLINALFDEQHFSQWKVWTGEHPSGTGLFVSDIAYDLKAQLLNSPSAEIDSQAIQAQERIRDTLSSFVDPIISESADEDPYRPHEFIYSVEVWNGENSRYLIEPDRHVDLNFIDLLEHEFEGIVDDNGCFKGKVRAFNGEWKNIDITSSFKVPDHFKSKIGPFHIRVGSYEHEERNSSIKDKAILFKIRSSIQRFGGFFAYRDGLRIMPYGRPENDFFEIEKRRTQHAGRNHYSARNMVGRIAISRELNPNLKDKAGREGFIDNKAAKAFRDLVSNILVEIAKKHIGTDSENRKLILPTLNADYNERKAEEERKKIKQKNRKNFRKNLKENSVKIAALSTEIATLTKNLDKECRSTSEHELSDLREDISELKNRHRELNLKDVPRNLGSLEEDYRLFRNDFQDTHSKLSEMLDTVDQQWEVLNPKSPYDIAFSAQQKNANFLHRRIRQWTLDASSLLKSELERVKELQEERNKAYHSETAPIIEKLEEGIYSLPETLERIDLLKEEQDQKNSELFEPYVSALQSLKESIDLEGLAAFTLDEADQLRQEIDRLNGLAQLGITVEIVGHEIEGLDNTVRRGLSDMPDNVKKSLAYKTALSAHQSLTERLEFLSPLKLSGQRDKRWLTGKDIYDYSCRFFDDQLENNNIELLASPEFLAFRVYDEPSRLYPVFINLLNNARYWVCQSDSSNRNILLDVKNNKVIICDDGPGVDQDDVKNLFTLFFTKRIRGGRGVGLYLCKANLAAGGHTINYVVDPALKCLPGANFEIDFRDAEYE